METNKLFSVVDAGFRSKLRAALVSTRYPTLATEEFTISHAEVLSGELKTVVFEVPLNYEIQVSTATILSAALENVAPPNVENSYPPEFIAISEPTLLSAELRTVVVNYNNYPEEQVTISSATLLSGSMPTVVVNGTAPEEIITLSAATILSGTLA